MECRPTNNFKFKKYFLLSNYHSYAIYFSKLQNQEITRFCYTQCNYLFGVNHPIHTIHFLFTVFCKNFKYILFISKLFGTYVIDTVFNTTNK